MKSLHASGRFFPDLEDKQGVDYIGHLKKINCPIAEKIQPKLMQFTTNQLSEKEITIQIGAFKKTIKYFNNQLSKNAKKT